MAAPKNNQFWKLRSKHGRKKIFETPDIMLDACYEYFEHQSKQKWERVDFRGKDAEQVKIPTSSPFTMQGLCIFLDVNTVYFNHFEDTLKGKDDEISKDFSKVITHIKEIIYTQKFEGAAVGAYNANIIARDLGLKDSQDITSKGETLNTEKSINLNLNGKNVELK